MKLASIKQNLSAVTEPLMRWFKASQNKARELGKFGFPAAFFASLALLVSGLFALAAVLNLSEIVLAWIIATVQVLYYGIGALLMVFLVTFFGQIAITGFRSRAMKKGTETHSSAASPAA